MPNAGYCSPFPPDPVLKEKGRRKKEKGKSSDFLSIRVSIGDRRAKPVLPPSLLVGERAGERGLRGGEGLLLPFAFG